MEYLELLLGLATKKVPVWLVVLAYAVGRSHAKTITRVVIRERIYLPNEIPHI